MSREIRHDWTLDEIRALYLTPFLELVFHAATAHREFHDSNEVQVCKLISVKTGACPEDCSYCSQSSRYTTGVKPTALMPQEEVMAIAAEAKASGVSRVCLGAAWREVKDNSQFERILEMVRGITDMGLEVCCTLGMLTEPQAKRLEEAGLYAYNHNIDTSEQFYETIITTRTYADRLKTIEQVRKTNVTVCSGGIIGLGESEEDRMAMLQTLATMNPHPESVPINILAKVPGTPMADKPDVPIWETVRMIALARLLMPASVVRLSAGRAKLSVSDQALCFMAGANSIFSSENGQMLTLAVPSPKYDADAALLGVLGMKARPPFKEVATAGAPA
ncbi:MAG: biotin synthase BioB [Planctomycetota bacterium]|nr:biotin synthase BioB [Planctomycetota bacterium]